MDVIKQHLNNIFQGPSKQVGDVFNASGLFFASNAYVEMGKTIVESVESKHVVILYHFGECFCQPFEENTFSKYTPKHTSDHSVA